MREDKGKIKVRKKWQEMLNEAYKEFKLISGLEDILLADLRTNPFQPGEIDVNPTPKQPISQSAQEEILRGVLYGSKVHSVKVVQLADLRTNPLQQGEIDVNLPSRRSINFHVDQETSKEEPFKHLEAIWPKERKLSKICFLKAQFKPNSGPLDFMMHMCKMRWKRIQQMQVQFRPKTFQALYQVFKGQPKPKKP